MDPILPEIIVISDSEDNGLQFVEDDQNDSILHAFSLFQEAYNVAIGSENLPSTREVLNLPEDDVVMHYLSLSQNVSTPSGPSQEQISPEIISISDSSDSEVEFVGCYDATGFQTLENQFMQEDVARFPVQPQQNPALFDDDDDLQSESSFDTVEGITYWERDLYRQRSEVSNDSAYKTINDSELYAFSNENVCFDEENAIIGNYRNPASEYGSM